MEKAFFVTMFMSADDAFYAVYGGVYEHQERDQVLCCPEGTDCDGACGGAEL